MKITLLPPEPNTPVDKQYNLASPSTATTQILDNDGDLDAKTISHNEASGDLSDGQEEQTGAFVPVNNDDDDYSGEQDREQNGSVEGENDLLPIVIRKMENPQGTYTLSTSGLKIYRSSDRSDPITGAFAVPGQDMTLYVEGTASGPHEITMTWQGNNRTIQVDKIKVTAFQWAGPLNVPQHGTYEYKVTTPPAQGAKWISSDSGTVVGNVQGPSDVKIKWGAGPVVGKASYQASGDYIWDLDVNVVQVKVEAPDQGQAFTAGTPFDGGTQGGNKTIVSGDPGLEWKAKVTLVGPNNNRGVKEMQVGFVQNATITALNGQYNGETNNQPNRLRSKVQGQTFWDADPKAPATPYYSYDPDAVFLNTDGSNTKTIKSNDTPSGGPPLFWNPNMHEAHLNHMNLIFDFDLYVVASTKEADNIYVGEAKAHWTFNGSGNVATTIPYPWEAGAGAGVTAPAAWIPDEGTQPKTSDPLGNKAIQQAGWEPY